MNTGKEEWKPIPQRDQRPRFQQQPTIEIPPDMPPPSYEKEKPNYEKGIELDITPKNIREEDEKGIGEEEEI